MQHRNVRNGMVLAQSPWWAQECLRKNWGSSMIKIAGPHHHVKENPRMKMFSTLSQNFSHRKPQLENTCVLQSFCCFILGDALPKWDF